MKNKTDSTILFFSVTRRSYHDKHSQISISLYDIGRNNVKTKVRG